jgi:hypothetical protein
VEKLGWLVGLFVNALGMRIVEHDQLIGLNTTEGPRSRCHSIIRNYLADTACQDVKTIQSDKDTNHDNESSGSAKVRYILKSSDLWDISLCIRLKVNRRFGGTCFTFKIDKLSRQ